MEESEQLGAGMRVEGAEDKPEEQESWDMELVGHEAQLWQRKCNRSSMAASPFANAV